MQAVAAFSVSLHPESRSVLSLRHTQQSFGPVVLQRDFSQIIAVEIM